MSAAILAFPNKSAQRSTAVGLRAVYLATLGRNPTPEDETIIQMMIEDAERDATDPGWREREAVKEKAWMKELKARRTQPLIDLVKGKEVAARFKAAWDDFGDWVENQPDGCQVAEWWSYVDWQSACEVYDIADSITKL